MLKRCQKDVGEKLLSISRQNSGWHLEINAAPQPHHVVYLALLRPPQMVCVCNQTLAIGEILTAEAGRCGFLWQVAAISDCTKLR